ncbi:hypothetical protein TVAG_126080 [Trichomonas vaginalis G3]|uniref:Right handed beta helix domain-containing protein n=1 Tax=Trichomonas vaginalis (strain ATCC PRA-98 / G3) TaxID=412133 RepID=A2ECZ6_TRIV3|nr:hypothetical protein TVAGG3_0860780 [Trichomonas vaginalis G3]EAY09447.1 hypothetical protein TVAG_126080 [Trichomonas vaginalis G3]KAI5500657.1 hypothetical protein TVAGG3_0860780 [Trichomonas vaginalis G3]|eukprot:XP_001321670.1 hypothetical protein [Trichomonas vaginalis G3]
MSPFNESLFVGLTFINFKYPIISVQGMELVYFVNCSFNNNQVSFDFPMLTFNNCTAIIANGTITKNIVEATSLVGLSTAILGLMNMTVEENTQLSRGPIPLFDFTNAASEISQTVFRNNSSPNSPLFGSWFFIIVYITKSNFTNNFCGSSALIVGDSLANITIEDSLITNNYGALVHSMTMSSINISNSKVKENFASESALVFAPRSSIQFLNQTIVENNIADSIISSQLTNETSLVLNSTIFVNNSCSDTAFALYNSNSWVINSTVSSNTVVGHPFISIQISNFTIDGSTFNSNWATNEGSVVKIEDCSVNANSSLFSENSGRLSGAFDIAIQTNETLKFVFQNLTFNSNEGKIVSSVYFSNKIPESRFEYCKFSKNRFDEVNGHLNLPQTFFRCRFNTQNNSYISFHISSTVENQPDEFVFIICLIFYVVSIILLSALILIPMDKFIASHL